MASDLSALITDGLCSTLSSLLAKDTSLKAIHKVDPKDFDGIQTLKIESTFEFENITSTWEFIIPAYSSSFIFNSMLGDDSEPSLEIDADIADAIGEFVSNVSGGLTTALKSAGFSDLGEAKFSIGSNEILEIGAIDDFDNTFKFTLEIDDKEIIIFIRFDKVIIPFIEHINSSPQSEYEDEEPEIDLSEIENLSTEDDEEPQEQEEEKQEETPTEEPPKEEEKKEEPPIEEKKEEVKEVENQEEQEELSDEEKKAKKLKIIIIAVGALLGLVIISAIVMYFLGWFDPPPPPPKVDQNITKKNVDKNGIEVVQYNRTLKKFDTSKINVKRLNARLALLTKYNILDIDEIEAQKEANKKRLERLKKEEELLKFAKQNKEEDVFSNKNNKKKKVEQTSTTKKPIKKELVEDNNPNKLRFVSSYTLKYKGYKTLLLSSPSVTSRISLCRDTNNNTIVFIGPFENSNLQKDILNKIKTHYDNSARSIIISKEEFNKRCDF